MSFDLVAVRDDIAGKLAATGYVVALDPRDVNPPCVLVGLPRVLGLQTACVARVETDVHVIAPPPGNADALAWLLDAVPVVYGELTARTADPVNYPIANQTLPAYRIVVAGSAVEQE